MHSMENTQTPSSVMPERVAIKSYKLPEGSVGPTSNDIDNWLKCKESPTYFSNSDIA